MTDRLKGLTVVFDDDIREDDAQPLIDAIGQLRGVLSVEPVKTTAEDYYARQRIARELKQKIYAVFEKE